jgi:hypothetical protein
MKILIGIIVFCTSVFTYSEEVQIDVIAGGWSYHNNRVKDYNETQESIGLKYNDYLLLRYRNSIDNESIVIGKYLHHYSYNENIKLGAIVAAVTGYNSSGAVPTYLPTLMLDGDRLATDIVILPGVVTYAHFRFKNLFTYKNTTEWSSPDTRKNAISYSYGSLGSAISYWRRINNKWDARLEGTNGYFGRATIEDEINIRYDEYLDTETYGLYLSYYPFNFPLAIEMGAVHNGTDYNAFASYLSNRDIVPARVKYSWDSASEYVGLRFGRPWNHSVMGYVQLGAYGLHGGKKQVKGIYDVSGVDIDRYKWYPVLQIGLTHTF